MCRDCVFAQYKNSKQVGCELGRLSAYQARGVEIKRFDENAKFDIGGMVKEEESFFTVGVFCNACRTKQWPLANNPDRAERVREIIRLPYNVVIGLSDDDSVYELETSLRSVLGQKYKPRQVVVIGWPTDSITLVERIRSIMEGSSIRWRFVRRVDEKPKDRQEKIRLMVNEGTEKAAHKGFYVYFNSDFTFPADFAEKLDWLYNYYMLRFIALEPFDEFNNGLVCFYPIHQQAGGIGKVGLIEKIQKRLEEDECPQLIYKIEEAFKLYDAQLSYPTTITLDSSVKQ